MKKFLARLALVGALASSAWAVSSAPAHADQFWLTSGDGRRGSSCPGRYYDGFDLYDRSFHVGAVFIYYSPANGGTYCAFTRNYGTLSNSMSISISSGWHESTNSGRFYSYAGTASLIRANGRCITIRGRHGYKWAERRVGTCRYMPTWRTNVTDFDRRPHW